MTVSARQAWVGFLILFVVMLLVLTAAFYWHHVTGVNPLHLIADVPGAQTTHGC
jgi:uncharacterized membrane protein AbrB (regulator of aidB expression)